MVIEIAVQYPGSLFDYLENDYSLEEFLECFPSVSRDLARQVLARSEEALLTPAA